MHFVDRDRRVEPAAGAGSAARGGLRQAADDRGGGGAQLGGEAVRIGFLRQDAAIARADFVLVASAGVDTGNEYLPDPAFAAQTHRMAPGVPGVEVADDADALRVRCPDGEGGTLDTVDFAQVGAEPFKGAQVRALCEEPDVEFAEDCGKAVGVVDFLYAAGPDNTQTVVELLVAPENRSFEEAGSLSERFDLALRQFDQNFAGIGVDGEDGRGARLHGAQPEPALGIGVQAEDGKGVAMFGATECEDFRLVQHGKPFRLV